MNRTIALVISLLGAAPCPAQARGRDLARRVDTARSAWSHETLDTVWAAPLVSPSGRIYVGSEDGFLYAFEAGGRLRWAYKASEGFSGWPVWIKRGLLAVGNRNGTIYLLNEAGEVRRKVTVEGVPMGRPAVRRGLLYVSTTRGQVVAIGERGLQWVHDAGSPVTGYPEASARQVHVGCKDGTVLALDDRGTRLWAVKLGSAVRGSIARSADNVVLALEDGTVTALASGDGRTAWQRKLTPMRGGVTALPGGGVVLGTLEGKLVALGPDGAVRWSFTADGPIAGTVTVAGRRIPPLHPGAPRRGARTGILFGTDRGTLYLLDPEGSPRGLYPVGGEIRGGITLDRGRALLGSTDRRLYVIPLDGAGVWRRAPHLKHLLLRTATGSLIWRRDLSGPVAAGVGRGTKGRLLAGTWGNRMFVLQADGRVQWSYNCGADVDTLPVMDGKGAVAFGCNDGGFYGLKPDGDLRYRLPVNKALASSPAATRDGTIYFGARDRRIYSVDRQGKVRWRIRTGGDVDGSPCIGQDGAVYIGSDDRHLYAIDPLGHIGWYHKFPAPIRSRPAISSKETIHVTAMDQRLYALAPDGQELWNFQSDGQIVSWPVVGPEGTVYFGSRDHRVYAVDGAGKLRWRFETASEVDSHPAIAHDGTTIHVGSDDGTLYALDAKDGSLRWWFPAHAAIRGGLVSRGDGSVVFGTMDGAVLAVGPPSRVAPPSNKNAPASKPATPPEHRHLMVGQGRYGPPLMLEDGTLVVAGVDGMVRAFGTDHWPLWSVRVGRNRLSRPMVLAPTAAQGVDAAHTTPEIYLTDVAGHLACIADGQIRFRLRLDRDPVTAPASATAPEGPLVLVGTRSGRVWAVTAAGKVRWFHAGEEEVEVVLGLGRSVLVAGGRRLTGLDLHGHKRWSIRMPAGINAGPVALTDSRALLGDGLGNLWAVSAGGAVVWKRDVGAGVTRVQPVPGAASATVLTADARMIEVAVSGELLLDRSPPLPPVEIAPAAGDVTYLVAANGTLLGLQRRTGEVLRVMDLASNETHTATTPAGVAMVVSDDGRLTLLRPRQMPSLWSGGAGGGSK